MGDSIEPSRRVIPVLIAVASRARQGYAYGEVLPGGATELSNYAYAQNVNAFGLSAGGGVNTALCRRIGWNIVEPDWIYTRLPNGVNTRQNLLRVITGITLCFGSR